MIRPPRPKYPSDGKNYHEIRKTGGRTRVVLDSQIHDFTVEGMGDPDVPIDEERIEQMLVDVDDVVSDREEETNDVNAADLLSEIEDVISRDSQAVENEGSQMRTYPDAEYGFWSKLKVRDFFLDYQVICSTEGCNCRFMPPKISEFQQLWSVQMKCLVVHKFSFLMGELERGRGTPDVTGKLYHSALYAGLTHTCLEASCEEAHDIAYKLKSWIYTCAKNATLRGDISPHVLTLDIHNSDDHWAGNHTTCRSLLGTRKSCVVEDWPVRRDAKYPEGILFCIL
ncbi:hypothetical protein R1sor_007535 [Riccia sorocarpa]|uniref:Uncharacterized protein n=1 Tax=Riccia sorocarpa TaxID=122646 RepID=A0ABD3HU60_9MARC